MSELKRVKCKGRTCSWKDCDRPMTTKGLCTAHAHRQRRGSDMDAPIKDNKNRKQTCSWKDCNEPVAYKNLCKTHYNRKRTGVDMDLPIRNKGKTCSVDWCNEPVYCKGLCARHYDRQRNGIDMDLPHYPQRPHLCAHEGCPRKAKDVKKGGRYCGKHQHRIDNNLPLDSDLRTACAHEGCPRKVINVLKGGKYCEMHQRRQDKKLPMDDPVRTGMNGTIYVLTCKVNGKRRVGLTTLTLEERLRYYESAAKHEINNEHPLYKDIRKYGIEAFTIEPIMVGIDSIDALNISEDAFIQILDTMHPKGYNMKEGGGFGFRYKGACTIPGCDGKYKGLGYCENHYRAFRIYGDPLGKAKPRQPRPACAVDSCNRESMTVSQYCEYHRDMNVKWGNPLGKFGGVIMHETECAADGCNESAEAKGWCASHYQIIHEHGHIPDGFKPKPRARCSTEGCKRPVRAKGRCKSCYQKWRNENPELKGVRAKLPERNAKILDMRKQGKTYKVIAKHLGISTGIVGNVCQSAKRV